VFKNDGNGNYTLDQTLASGLNSDIADVVDLNGDGLLDILTGGDAQLLGFFQNADGSYSAATTLATDASLYKSITIGDFDEDGRDDIAVGTNFGSQIEVYRNNGDGTISGLQSIDRSGIGVRALRAVDADDDGQLDLVATDSTANAISIYRGLGTGRFSSASTISVDASTYGLAIGDITGDGILDFITSNSANGNIRVTKANSYTGAALSEFNLSRAADSSRLLEILDSSLETLMSAQSKLGIFENRLEFSLEFASRNVTSLEDARSRIEDADLSIETSELVRLQISQQATIAAMVQANMMQSRVLELLKF
jgi:flagellin-like hook-associated protein FlgL